MANAENRKTLRLKASLLCDFKQSETMTKCNSRRAQIRFKPVAWHLDHVKGRKNGIKFL
jgi:hypothetical protein